MDVWLGLAWAGLLPLKLAGLVWALKLRLPTLDAVTLGTTLVAIQTVPLLLDSRRLEPESVLTFCVWGFAALLVYCHTRDGFGMVVEPSTDGCNRQWLTTVTTRIRRAVGIGLVVAVIGHIATWIAVFDLEVPAHHMVPVLLALAWIGNGNLLTWGAALAAPIFVSAQLLPITLFVVAGLFVFLATTRNPALHCTAAWTFTYLGTLETLDYFTLRSAADWPAHLIFVLGAIISAWLLRHGLPLAPAAVVVAVGCSQLKFEPLTVGVALIALAFTSLGLGTWLTSRWGPEKTQAIGTSDSL